MTKRLIYLLVVTFCLCIVAAFTIAFSRGYRFNFNQRTLATTGILSASSIPDGASIFIDGKLTAATNTSISLSPNWYQVKIGKEGYQSWEKKIKIQGEIVSRIEALLIPENPSLRALTVTGVRSPTLSPSGSRVAYIVPDDQQATSSGNLTTKTGVWILELRNLPLRGTEEPKQIYKPLSSINWTEASLVWSADEKQVILISKKTEGKKEKVINALALSVDNNIPSEVTLTLPKILQDWEQEKKQKEEELIASFVLPTVKHISTSSSNLKFSPDETKILYLATTSATLKETIIPPLIGSNPTTEIRAITPGKFYIYDTKEDKNYFIADLKTVPSAELLVWHNDSKHIVMIDKDTIYIVDYDGTNKRPVYVGPFLNNLSFPWTSGGKLVILTNFNKPQMLPNLYEIDLR